MSQLNGVPNNSFCLNENSENSENNNSNTLSDQIIIHFDNRKIVKSIDLDTIKPKFLYRNNEENINIRDENINNGLLNIDSNSLYLNEIQNFSDEIGNDKLYHHQKEHESRTLVTRGRSIKHILSQERRKQREKFYNNKKLPFYNTKDFDFYNTTRFTNYRKEKQLRRNDINPIKKKSKLSYRAKCKFITNRVINFITIPFQFCWHIIQPFIELLYNILLLILSLLRYIYQDFRRRHYHKKIGKRTIYTIYEQRINCVQKNWYNRNILSDEDIKKHPSNMLSDVDLNDFSYNLLLNNNNLDYKELVADITENNRKYI